MFTRIGLFQQSDPCLHCLYRWLPKHINGQLLLILALRGSIGVLHRPGFVGPAKIFWPEKSSSMRGFAGARCSGAYLDS